MSVICNYCQRPARLALGQELYPHRTDLEDVRVWRCDPCNAQVGCHDGTDKPKGTFANPQLAKLRMAVHRLFDPLWQDFRHAYPMQEMGAPPNVIRRIARNRAYEWLTVQMNAGEQVHIGHMDEAACEQALSVLRQHRPTPMSIRMWAKARKAAA